MVSHFWTLTVYWSVNSAENGPFTQSISITIWCQFNCLTGSLTPFWQKMRGCGVSVGFRMSSGLGWRAGGVAPHISTRRRRRVGAFLAESFLRHASFVFQSILPVKDCLQTWISGAERERESYINQQFWQWSTHPRRPTIVLWKLASPELELPPLLHRPLISDTADICSQWMQHWLPV